MTLNEETTYLHGNLGREWTQKEIPSTGKKVLENALAFSPTKDSDTIWVDLTVWENDGGDTSHFKAIQTQSSKGSRVIIRGRFKPDGYKGKDGTWKDKWKCSVWDIATVIRTKQQPSNFSPGTGHLGPADDSYKAAFKENTGLDYDDDDKELPF